jgi:hypothetical protein
MFGKLSVLKLFGKVLKSSLFATFKSLEASEIKVIPLFKSLLDIRAGHLK